MMEVEDVDGMMPKGFLRDLKYMSVCDSLANDLNTLEQAAVYERTHIRGDPSCSTLANRMRENINFLFAIIEDSKDNNKTSEL